MMRKMRGEEAILALGGTQKQERERIKKGRDHVFHTIVQETIATKEFEAEKKQENETRWMEIRAMEMHKVVIEEKLRVLEEELQMKKVVQKMQDYIHGHYWVLRIHVSHTLVTVRQGDRSHHAPCVRASRAPVAARLSCQMQPLEMYTTYTQ